MAFERIFAGRKAPSDVWPGPPRCSLCLVVTQEVSDVHRSLCKILMVVVEYHHHHHHHHHLVVLILVLLYSVMSYFHRLYAHVDCVSNAEGLGTGVRVPAASRENM